MARPTINEPSVAAEVATRIAPQIVDWLRSHGDSPDVAGIERDACAVLCRVSDRDGYRLARYFEYYGYKPDESLVDVLSHVGSLWQTVEAELRDVPH